MPRQRLSRGVNRTVLIIAVVVSLADAASKWWARLSLSSHAVHVAGPWWWRLQFNQGVSFSFSHGLPMVTAVGTLLVAITVIVIGLRAYRGLPTWGFGLLLGGGVANVIDRWSASPPRVTDFIAVGTFPVFNVADVAVTGGFIVLLIAIMQGQRLVQR